MDKVRRALERIASDGKRAAEVIRRIRALMKRQTPRKEWLDINETILEVVTLAQYQLRRNEIRHRTELGRDLPLGRSIGLAPKSWPIPINIDPFVSP
jgi:signal transduction histidine kinase